MEQIPGLLSVKLPSPACCYSLVSPCDLSLYRNIETSPSLSGPASSLEFPASPWNLVWKWGAAARTGFPVQVARLSCARWRTRDHQQAEGCTRLKRQQADKWRMILKHRRARATRASEYKEIIHSIQDLLVFNVTLGWYKGSVAQQGELDDSDRPSLTAPHILIKVFVASAVSSGVSDLNFWLLLIALLASLTLSIRHQNKKKTPAFSPWK